MEFLTLFISLRCTQSCAHCLYGCSPKRGEHMSWDVFSRSMDIAGENGIRTLNFFGGEPLVNPLFFRMLQAALEKDFSVILATNCRPLDEGKNMAKLLEMAGSYKSRMVIVTARDKFHLKFFDPEKVIVRLRNENFQVVVQDYANHLVALSEHNSTNLELKNLDTSWSCCQTGLTDYLGVLPDGAWTICPPSLEGFGNVFSQSVAQILEFKRGLPLNNTAGCTECLKNFKSYRQQFEAIKTPSRTEK